MNRIQLSQNFYLDEFLRSQVAARQGIEMLPGSDLVLLNLRRLALEILQPLRDELGPVYITSGYRPPELNRLIGGSAKSRHCLGLAADLVVTGHSPLEVCQWVEQSGLAFDQCIHEFGRWVHVAAPYSAASTAKRELLTATKTPRRSDGKLKTKYEYGIHPVEV